ncbi:MAG: hypothetical protein RI911_34 [Candidatus Parcubacteria bacterium]|jgi:hypothetical protein
MSTLEGVSPHTFSRHLRPEEVVQHLGDSNPILEGIYVHPETHERFYQVEKFPETQQFVARILKGFVHVSDIVKHNGAYFSYQESIDAYPRTGTATLRADIALVGEVFHDDDHTIPRQSGPDQLHIENARLERGRHTMFDFDTAYAGFWDDDRVPVEQEPISKDAAHILHRKCKRMIRWYTSSAGKEQFKAALEATGKTPQVLFLVLPGDARVVTEDTLREEIVRRLKECMQMAHMIINASG